MSSSIYKGIIVITIYFIINYTILQQFSIFNIGGGLLGKPECGGSLMLWKFADRVAEWLCQLPDISLCKLGCDHYPRFSVCFIWIVTPLCVYIYRL